MEDTESNTSSQPGNTVVPPVALSASETHYIVNQEHSMIEEALQ
jgi:hypothetical protein